ncbi:ribose ABC transporter permease [Spirochaetia bacterium]|nr:ribose ABC transporter permease [Spirochaetia bacterium]
MKLKINSYINPLLEWTPLPSLLLVIIFTVVSAVISPFFLSKLYLPNFIGAYIPVMILSIGQFVVLISGGIDISIGAIMTLVNVLIVHLIGLNFDPLLAFTLGGLVGIALGCINGLVVSMFRVNAMLVTLATQSIASGIALAILPAPGGKVPMKYVLWYMDSISILPLPLIFVLLVAACWLIIYFTPLGKQLFAVGENLRMAFVSAIKVKRVQFFAYAFAGFAAAIAGIAVSGSIGSGSAKVGLPLTLNSVAACVIGGISLSGGKGSIIGSILGAFFLALVFNIVISIRISPYLQSFISGLVVLLCIVGISAFSNMRKNRPLLSGVKD